MKRRLLKLACLLLLGAVINVAVAWGLAAKWPTVWDSRRSANFVDGDWLWWTWDNRVHGAAEIGWRGVHHPDSTPSQLERVRLYADYLAVHKSSFPVEAIDYEELPTWGDRWFSDRERDDGRAANTNRASGWPCLSLWCQVKRERPDPYGGPQDVPARVKGAIIISANSWDGTEANLVSMPYWLLWPAFAINTVFYALILWGLFSLPGVIRRRWRAQHDRCPACSYPVGMSLLCTECGAAVKPKS